MKKKTVPFKDGDVLMAPHGSLVLVRYVDAHGDGYNLVQNLETTEDGFMSHDTLEKWTNLGQSPEIIFQFNLAHSIHVRLNRLGTV